jgi:class 3 adenylate cyclase
MVHVDAAPMELRTQDGILSALGIAVSADLAGTGFLPPRRTRKVCMFTDIVRSTALIEVIGDEAWMYLLRWHDQTLRSHFATHAGEEVKRTGDGFFVVFDDAASAIACAIAIQRALARHRRDHGFAPLIRIGLHQAEVISIDADYCGKGVHEAARIGALAGASEILASAPLVRCAGDTRASGPHAVTPRGLSHPVEVVTIEWR